MLLSWFEYLLPPGESSNVAVILLVSANRSWFVLFTRSARAFILVKYTHKSWVCPHHGKLTATVCLWITEELNITWLGIKYDLDSFWLYYPMKINSTQNKKYFWLFLAAFFLMFIKQLSITTGFTKQTPWKTSWNLMEIPQTSPRALSWAATAGCKFHHCQVLLITSSKLFGGEQSLAHRLFSFAWKQEVCLGSSVTLEFGLKRPACLIDSFTFLTVWESIHF